MLTGLFKSTLSWPKTKSLYLSGTKDQGNSYALILLVTYLTVSNVSQEPSNYYTYQAVHIFGGLHKWFSQQLTPWRLFFLESLEKRPANVYPLSLHHLLILGRPRTLVSKQPAYVSLPYGLCVVLPFKQRAHTHVHIIYHCSRQSKYLTYCNCCMQSENRSI